MRNDNKKKKEPWRIVVCIIAVAVIVFMWVRKDIVAIYNTTSQEKIVPLILTTIAVSLLKVALIVGIVFLIKWIFGKIKK